MERTAPRRYMADKNRVTLVGRLEDYFIFDHCSHDKNIYSSFMIIKRLSGETDRVPVCINEEQLEALDGISGNLLKKRFLVRGQLVTAVKGGKYVVTVRITSDFNEVSDVAVDKNEVEIEGYLASCEAPRRTPSGRYLCDFRVISNRNYGKILNVHALAWEKVADYVYNTLTVGSRISMKARLQSRKYQKFTDDICEEKEAFELSTYYIGEIETKSNKT